MNDGNSPVTNYILEQRRIDFETWELVADDIEPAAYVVEGLLPNVPYLFRVAAVNTIGMSPFSKPSPPITMATETGVPTNHNILLVYVKKQINISKSVCVAICLVC